jgi:hypothetical protein
MVSMSDELTERNILKLILILRFARSTLDLGHPIYAKTHLYALLYVTEPFKTAFSRK